MPRGARRGPVIALEGPRTAHTMKQIVSALTVDDVTVQIYDAAGRLHCSYDHQAYAVAHMTDWFADRLRA